MGNPFFEAWATPFGAPPFDAIRAEHFMPAFQAGLDQHKAEIDAIATNRAPPDFNNVIAALERAGEALGRVSRVFWTLASSDGTPEMQAIERDISPVLSRHWSAIYTRRDVFERVDAVHAQADRATLSMEESRLLDLTHRSFVRSGARLDEAGRARISEIDARLAELGTQFSQNILEDEAGYLMVLEEEDLDGLPQSTRAAAAHLARERGFDGKWAFSLSRSSVEPFLTYSTRRALREKLFSAWVLRGEMNAKTDNRPLAAQTLRLRAERAALLGYPSYAHFKLDGTMAGDPQAARNLLDTVWPAGLSRARAEKRRLEEIIAAEGGNFALAAHDWRHYAEKARRLDHDFDEMEVRAYLPLERVLSAAFDTASRLFGLTFRERFDVPLYAPDVRAFEVLDSSGEHAALFYADYFARPTKRSGAWMTQFLGQQRLDKSERPIVVNVMNLAKGGDGATLLGLEEARTLFHEFGHGLHGMLSDVVYPSMSGTSVPTDFVELPSQLYEHWLLRPEVLRRFARHHATGAPMPEDLERRLLGASKFNQGFATVEYCASALVDLDQHMIPADGAPVDPMRLEAQTLERIGMPAEIAMRHRTPHFSHIYSGDHYAAGYYSYLWSELLDADAFRAFEETGDVFDRGVADRLRRFVLSAGNSREPKEAYTAFRGHLPDARPLLEKRGLAAPDEAA